MAYAEKVSLGGTSIWASNITGGKHGNILERAGFGGVRTHYVRNTRAGPYSVKGGWQCEPSPSELLALLAWAINGTELAVVNDRVADQKSFADTKCNTLQINGRSGMEIAAQVDWVGMLEASGSTVAAPTSTSPYAFCPDVTITLASSARAAKSFELLIDNKIATDRNLNSLSLTEVNPTDQLITLKVVVPWVSANTALYDQALAGAAGSLTLAQTGFSNLVIAFGALQVPPEPPTVEENELVLALNMTARATDAEAAITVSGGEES
jgi:hypothetical protein